MKMTNIRKFILVLPGVAALALSPVYAGGQSAEKWHKPNWKQQTGKGYQMCDALLEEMKSYKSLLVSEVGSETLCAIELIIPHSRLFTPPSWEKLDPQQYRPLLRKLFIGEFYMPEDGRKKLTQEEMAETELEIDKFIKNGGYLRKWTIPFPEWMENEALLYNIPKTPLTYVQTVRPFVEQEIRFITDRCSEGGGGLPNNTNGGIQLVNTQLEGPDPRLINYSYASSKHRYEPHSIIVLRNTIGKRIYLYRRIPYFFDNIRVVAFSMRKKEWAIQNAYCDIYSTEK